MQERVVITGMGTVNPLGLNVSESWQNAIEGVSGVGPITLFDDSDLQVHIACEVKNFEPGQFMEPREARRRDRFEQFSTVAVKEAMDSIKDFDPHGLGTKVTFIPEDRRGYMGVRICQVQGGEVVPVTDWREAPRLIPSDSSWALAGT